MIRSFHIYHAWRQSPFLQRLATLLLLLALSLLRVITANAQLSGVVSDSEGNPLPFAHIYIAGSSCGTSSNVEGVYELELKPGNYKVIFQFIGCAQKVVDINFVDSLTLDVTLTVENVELEGLMVKSDAEDPAYAIIREAIKVRKSHLQALEAYKCETYIKGKIRLDETPEKIMGNEVGNMGGLLDEKGQGNIYLSETESTFYHLNDRKEKEIIHSSIVAGDDQGFSFNRAIYSNFNIYENLIEFERDIVSPVANAALAYYNYSLEGYFSEGEREIYKIKVIPKRVELPCFSGVIYIVDKEWSVHSFDLALVGESIKLAFVDTMRFRQTHAYLEKQAAWKCLNQVISFKLGLFGFKSSGDFTTVYSLYDTLEATDLTLFNSEIVRFTEDAAEKDSLYWLNSRPIPLISEEKQNYKRRDSLAIIHKSESFLDSMDAKNNKFGLSNLIMGYTRRNSFKKHSIGFSAPLDAFYFNPVQGYNLGIDFNYKKWNDEGKRTSIRPAIQYGLSSKDLNYGIRVLHQSNQRNYERFMFEYSKEYEQFSRIRVSPLSNTLNNLLRKKSKWRAMQTRNIVLAYSKILAPGFSIFPSIRHSERDGSITNTTNYSYFAREKTYASNFPIHPYFDEFEQFEFQNLAQLGLLVRYIPGEKIESMPKQTFYLGSSLPRLSMNFKRAIGINDSYASFTHLEFRIKDELDMGLAGYGEVNFRLGDFFGRRNMSFPDFKHFASNNASFNGQRRGTDSFVALPFHSRSTSRGYIEFHYQQHFEGYVLDKLPLLRKLKWKVVAGSNFLIAEEYKPYMEFNLGIENIGVSVFRPLRIDFVYREGLDNFKKQIWRITLENPF